MSIERAWVLEMGRSKGNGGRGGKGLEANYTVKLNFAQFKLVLFVQLKLSY